MNLGPQIAMIRVDNQRGNFNTGTSGDTLKNDNF